jgi:hypothetical protein
MGSVVDFPGNRTEPREPRVEEADFVTIVGLDEDFVPLYATDMPVWWGLCAFYGEGDDVSINLFASFKDRRDALTFAVMKNETVQETMPHDIITRMRLAIAGFVSMDDFEPPEGGDDDQAG